MSVSVPTKKLNINRDRKLRIGKTHETGQYDIKLVLVPITSAVRIRRNSESSTGSKRRQSETSFESKRTRVEEKTDSEASTPMTADEYAVGESPSDEENLLKNLNSYLYNKPSGSKAKAYPNCNWSHVAI